MTFICTANKKQGQLPPALSALAGHSAADGSFLSSDQPRQPGAPQLVHVIQPPLLDKSAIGGGATTSIPADTEEHTHTHILMVRPTQLVVYTNLGAHGTSSAQSGASLHCPGKHSSPQQTVTSPHPPLPPFLSPFPPHPLPPNPHNHSTYFSMIV